MIYILMFNKFKEDIDKECNATQRDRVCIVGEIFRAITCPAVTHFARATSMTN
jgi:hypothetical protein